MGNHTGARTDCLRVCARFLLDRLLAKFNFFVAVGAARNESRHSDFLRVLLTPTESHGLGDRFLKNFLLRALREAPAASPEFRLELARASLQDALVEGEENRIDLLIVNERLRFGVVVENKVATGEHDNQLERYWSVIHSHYPGLVRRFGGASYHQRESSRHITSTRTSRTGKLEPSWSSQFQPETGNST